MNPENLKFTENHEWIKIEGNEGVIGITEHAQNQLGDIVFVELPEVDDHFDKGEILGSVESVKSVSDIYLPATGTVIEINENLIDQPELVNKDPYDEGWLVKIEIADASEVETLLSIDEYKKQLD